MNFQQVLLQLHQSVDRSRHTIRFDAPLADVVYRTANGDSQYLVVEDDAGRPVGVVSIEDVLQPSSRAAPAEIVQWLERPVESALSGRLHPPAGGQRTPVDDSLRSTVVTHNDRIVGVMTDDDVFVSWRAVRNTLRHAHGDFVTGLPDRGIFEARLQSECSRAARAAGSVGVILVDLDRFKSINDEFGHAAGDLTLKKIGETLQSGLRSFDLITRYGGDEFAVLWTGCKRSHIDSIVGRLLNRIRTLRVSAGDALFTPSVSIGAAVAHDVSALTVPDQIVQAADVCLYAAKNAGRDCAWKSEFVDPGQAVPVAVRAVMPDTVDGGVPLCW